MTNAKDADGFPNVINLMDHAKFAKRAAPRGAEKQLSPPSQSAPAFKYQDVSQEDGSEPRRRRGARLDPHGHVLPAGIRYIAARPKLPYRVEQEIQEPNGSWRSTSKSFPTLAAAKKGLGFMKLDIAQGNPPPGKRSKVSLVEFRSEVQSTVLKSGRASNTVRDYDRAWRIRIMPDLGSMKLGDISTDLLEETIQGWLESATASTVNSALTYLSQLLDKAVAQKRIRENPVSKIKRPKSIAITNVTDRALTGQQQGVLLGIMRDKDPNYDLFIQTLLQTGLRFNEATALRVGDVNLSDNVLAVKRAYHLNDEGKLEIGPTKGKRDRKAPIPESLRQVLGQAVLGKASTDNLLTTPEGAIIRGGNLRRALNWESVRCEVGKPDLCFHDLRHTAATNMLNMGVPPHDVRAILGHSDLATTNIYAGSHDNYATRAADVINKQWSSILPK